MKCFVFFLLVFAIIGNSYGQSPNVNCASAFEITNPTAYCSGVDEFDNTNAGGSEFSIPDCWTGGENDLWFSFTSNATAVNVAINAEAGGDLDNPQVILYKADDCSMIFEVGSCETTAIGDEIASIFNADLVVGDNYFIRVSGRFTREGSFQICVNNYNPPVTPGQDCVTASFICNKNSFVVQSVEGGGNDPDEGEGTCLSDMILGNSERSSTWFKWICDESGTLTFDITPLVPTSDLDFALYRLPNGINDCEKEVLRCNATESGADHLCGISTGLNLNSSDFSEDIGCELDDDPNDPEQDDGYVQFIDMIAGEAYALLINNFDDKSGFSIDFGGTGTFQGPVADFEIIPDPSAPCGTDFVINNLSMEGVSSITDLQWDFGDGATPETGTGAGPFNVSYSSAGEKFIVLTVTSDLGCQVTEVRNVNLDDCPESLAIISDNIGRANCDGVGGGFIEVSGFSGCPDYMFNIDGGTFSSTAVFNDLDMGSYTIGMMDMNGCEIDSVIFVESAANFEVEAGDDVSIDAGSASISLNASTTATGDVTISWDPTVGISCPDGSTNCLDPEVNPTSTTIYTITITDSNGCVSMDSLTVFVDQCVTSTLELALDSIRSQICTADQSGYIQVSAINGELDYQYNIDGGPFSDVGIFDNLGIGQYTIGIRDGLGCTVDSIFTINPFPGFTVNAGDDVTFDTPGDTIILEASTTATDIASITWEPNLNIICDDGSLNCLNPMVRPNTNSGYTLTVTDINGCTATDVINFILVENTDIFIPNVFSPNEDGVNDFFSIFGDPGVIESIEEFIVFDRWGNKVFQGNNLPVNSPELGWDGRLNGNKVKPGVYTWAAKVRFVSKPDADADNLSGSITLIR